MLGVHRSQNRAPDPLELQVVVSYYVGAVNIPLSAARATSALSDEAIS